MTADAAAVLGRPMWFELMTPELDAAVAFYTNVVGWTSAPFGGSPEPYVMFNRAGSIPAAGALKTPAHVNAPPFWSMYIGVPDLEAAAAKVTKLGGARHTDVIDVPGIGRMQLMADPQGAVFYLYQPASDEHAPEGPADVGEASWLELMTTDAGAAMRFYQDLFGWQPSDALDMGELGTYQMFNRPHGMIGGMMNKSEEMAQVPPNWQIYFRVPEITEAVERIKSNGGQIFNGPMEVPGGDWVVNAMDPQGAAFSLHAKAK